MAELTPTQERTRGAVEALITVMEPALDLVLAVGERISRAVEPEDHDYYPPRPFGEEERLSDAAQRPPAQR